MCSIKDIFISFCLPATATFISTFFNIYFKKDEAIADSAFRIIGVIASCFYIIIAIVGFYTHYTFYSTQYIYRKVKDSIETLNEKIIFLENDIKDDITAETFRSYYKALSNVSKNTTPRRTIIVKTLKDAVSYLAPITIIVIFWILVIFRIGGLI